MMSAAPSSAPNKACICASSLMLFRFAENTPPSSAGKLGLACWMVNKSVSA